MWQIKIEEEASEVFEGNLLTLEDRIVIQKWAQTVSEFGPIGLQIEPSVWADHALFGDWRGYRSSRFSYSGRIIYRVERDIITVVVVRITTTHNYKK